MEFIAGTVVGFVVAGLIGRAKFLKVQNKLREIINSTHDEITTLRNKLIREERLTSGLAEELDAVATKSRMKTV